MKLKRRSFLRLLGLGAAATIPLVPEPRKGWIVSPKSKAKLEPTTWYHVFINGNDPRFEVTPAPGVPVPHFLSREVKHEGAWRVGSVLTDEDGLIRPFYQSGDHFQFKPPPEPPALEPPEGVTVETVGFVEKRLDPAWARPDNPVRIRGEIRETIAPSADRVGVVVKR